MKIVVDAYAWIEVFRGSEAGRRAKKIIEEADNVLTPGTVLAEVARKYFREGAAEPTIRKRLVTMLETSETVEVDAELAVEAAKAAIQLDKKAASSGLRKPSLFDGIVLASARRNKAKVLTGDEHFRGLAETA
ncbi:MAG: PIN domain-containing protein, partial [Thaumarchaeota archaeon]|nr:PIN domain-containing protein [Nitrososphaerota archaeon]